MAIEYLLVNFPEDRAVLADGKEVGVTNHTFMLETDEYLITLDGSGYQPPSLDVPLSGTTIGTPMVISFMRAPAAAALTPPTSSAAGRPTGPARSGKKHG